MKLPLLVLLALLVPGCKILRGRPASLEANEVFVLGTIHGDHVESEPYSLDRLEGIVRAINPQLVICEIPPDRFRTAWDEYVREGEVSEPRIALYPEFCKVLFPMALEGRLRLRPASAWTADMAEQRSARLAQWKVTRPADSRLVDDARARAERQLDLEGLAGDPVGIHCARYDELVAEGMAPYESFFGRDLGRGGWQQINEAHYQLISEELDRVRGDGIRVLVVFGAWHKYRLRELIGERKDVELSRIGEVLDALPGVR